VPSENKPPRPAELLHRVKAILANKALTLRQVSQTTERLYGRSSPFYLPHNFYYDLGLQTFTPSLHQLFALSRISNFRLTDWMDVFGFPVNNLTRLQVMLPFNRTTLLETSIDNPSSWVGWFESRPFPAPLAGIVPMGRLLEPSSSRRIGSLSRIDNHSFLFAKLGTQDSFAFPELLPGSIVRVNPKLKAEPTFWDARGISDQFFLIQHTRGLFCCRIQPVANESIIPISTQLPYAQVKLRTFEQATILGVVDLEIRSLRKTEQPEVPPDLAKHWKPEPQYSSNMKLGQLLRHARRKMALSFREASGLTRQIAADLGSQEYFASPGSLCDYEALESPPRHVHKVISLCAIYGLSFMTFVRAAGLGIEGAGCQPMPDQFLDRPSSARLALNEDTPEIKGESVRRLLKDWDEEIPLFLRGSLRALSGLSNLSLHDVFWINRQQGSSEPNLNGTFLAIVNRRMKSALHWRSKPLWQQPLYVVLKRDGSYVCAFASIEDGMLVLHSYSHGYHLADRLRYPQDAEIVGQIVALARKLL
jgi:hypothetical protein